MTKPTDQAALAELMALPLTAYAHALMALANGETVQILDRRNEWQDMTEWQVLDGLAHRRASTYPPERWRVKPSSQLATTPVEASAAALLQAPPVPEAGMSWSGFNLFGDAASIQEARRLLHDAGTVPELKQRIAELQAPPVPEPIGYVIHDATKDMTKPRAFHGARIVGKFEADEYNPDCVTAVCLAPTEAAPPQPASEPVSVAQQIIEKRCKPLDDEPDSYDLGFEEGKLFDVMKNANRLADLYKQIDDLTRDRDGWKQEHENLLFVRQQDLAALTAKRTPQPAAKPAQPTVDEREALIELVDIVQGVIDGDDYKLSDITLQPARAALASPAPMQAEPVARDEPVATVEHRYSTQLERVDGIEAVLNDAGEKLPVGTRLFTAPAAQSAPDGWVMVPVEPDETMESVGDMNLMCGAADVYRSMIAASPTQPRPQPLTEEQVAEACGWKAGMGCKPLPRELRIARAIEAAHGITAQEPT